MRFAHISDLHFAPETLDEVDRCMEFALKIAVDSRADILIETGDSTDHELDVHSPAFLALAKRMAQFADSMPVVMLQGTYSHEPRGTLDVFRLLASKFPIYVADRIHQVAWDGVRFIPSRGAVFSVEEIDGFSPVTGKTFVVFTCVPTVNKANVAAAVGVVEAGIEVGSILDSYLQSAGEVNMLLRSKGYVTAGLSHGTITGCTTEHGVPMAGLDNEFTLGSLFDAKCDFFAMGHIHRSQTWAMDGRLIGYAGSIARLHHGEIGEKGLLLWDVDGSSVSVSQEVVPTSRYREIVFDGPPDMEELRRVAADIAGQHVKISWVVDQEHAQSIDRTAIRELFAAAVDLKLDGRVLPIVRSRAEGISRAKSLDQKLIHWAATTQTDATPLLPFLGMLTELEVDEIVRSRLDFVRSERQDLPHSAAALPMASATPDETVAVQFASTEPASDLFDF